MLTTHSPVLAVASLRYTGRDSTSVTPKQAKSQLTGGYSQPTRRTTMTPGGKRVLQAAAELFYRDGINAVGVAAVAQHAGVTKKTLYDCFGSKADLVVAYLHDRHETWWTYLGQRLADAGSPAALTVFDAYLDHPALDSSRGCAFLNAAAELPHGHPGLEVVRHHKSAVQAKLAELAREDAPHADDPDGLADHLFLILEGAIAHTRIDGDDRRTQQAKKIAAALLNSERAAR
jgi:AcrR family transcriptional regulator